MFESYKNVLKRGGSHLVTSLRAIIFAVLTGIVLGFVGTAFYYGMRDQSHYHAAGSSVADPFSAARRCSDCLALPSAAR